MLIKIFRSIRNLIKLIHKIKIKILNSSSNNNNNINILFNNNSQLILNN